MGGKQLSPDQWARLASPEVGTVHVPIEILLEFDSLIQIKKDMERLVQATLRLTRAALESVRMDQPQTVELSVDPAPLVNAIHSDSPLDALTAGHYRAVVGIP